MREPDDELIRLLGGSVEPLDPPPGAFERIVRAARRRRRRHAVAVAGLTMVAVVALGGLAAGLASQLHTGDGRHVAPLGSGLARPAPRATHPRPAPPSPSPSPRPAPPSPPPSPGASTGGEVTPSPRASASDPVSDAATLFAAPAPTGIPRCRAADLSAQLQAVPGQAGVSKAGRTLLLRNTSVQSCWMRGYVGLELEDADHRPLPTRTRWGATYFAADPGPQKLVLDPGETASANLAWATADAPVNVDASFLRITPPDETTYLTVPFATPHITGGELQVTALSQ